MRLINLIIVVAFLASCKEDEVQPVVDTTLPAGMAVLCEGLFQQNNSSVSWVGFGNNEVTNSLFLAKTGRQLGDTGNDMKRYGGKIYIVVNVSSTVEVMDASTFTSLQQISMITGGTAKQPRQIEFYQGKAYVSCFDGFVDVIDTTTLQITERIPVGSNPEGMAVSGGKLYVANSGGLNAPAMDSTVSVIDLASNTELQKITVGLNPGGVEVDDNGDVYVIARGNYGAIPSRMVRIDALNDVVAEQFAFDASGISRMNDRFLISYYNFSSGSSSVGLFNPNSESMENSAYLNLANVTTLYGVQYNPVQNRIYVMDAMNYTNSGYVRQFDASGTYLQSFHVGLNPSKAVFYE